MICVMQDGLIIGRHGETILNHKKRSQAHIQVLFSADGCSIYIQLQ
jgi:hypothetical protein